MRGEGGGLADALEAAGLRPDHLVAHGSFSVAGGRTALRALLDRAERRPPDSGDLLQRPDGDRRDARGGRAWARRAGRLVVGFDGIDAGTWTQPPLTTVEQPIDEIAETAIAALQRQIDAPEQTRPSYVFRPRFREGGTNGPPPSPERGGDAGGVRRRPAPARRRPHGATLRQLRTVSFTFWVPVAP